MSTTPPAKNWDRLTLMIDQLSGKVRYAVMEFGGFLGIGANRYPLPWEALKYDTNVEGYVVSLAMEQLEQAPKYAQDTTQEYTDDYRSSRLWLLRHSMVLRH